MNGINAPQRPDCVADDAVSCELVSAPNSLLTGKLTGNFAESEPSATILTFNQRANSKACRQIPYTAEQGNFAAITGNFFGITGNLIERGKRPLFARLFCACRTRSVLTCLFAKRGGTDAGQIVLSRALRRAVLAGAPLGVASKRFESARGL